MDRRQFLDTTSRAGLLASAGFVQVAGSPPSTSAQEPSTAPATSPKAKRRVAVIGTGWYGKCDVLRLMQVEPVDVVALCDVDSKMLADASDLITARGKLEKPPALFGDYREMLKEVKPEIVLVGTPDHWHALTMIAAVEAGADVYVQKPTSVDVAESQAMLAAARKHGRVVQVGTQRRSTPHIVEAKEKFIDTGMLGKIGLVEVYCYYHMRAKDNPLVTEPPASLDYEMWAGPAPKRPFTALVHPRRWRAFTEYGNGIMGDMCIHMLDCTRFLLGLGWPQSVASVGGIYVDPQSQANIPDTQTATFDFNGLDVVWQHRSYGSSPDAKYPWGLTIYGDKGTLKVSVMGYDFIPQGKGEAVHKDVTFELEQYPEDKTEKDLEKHVAPAIRQHMRDFLKAIDQRSKPVADIEEGHISTVSCILANLSLELGRTLHWDAATGTVIGDEEANKKLARPYRAPWVHPGA
ncbi:MAG: oxidoreductase [Planctomyces sp.]|nr:oxidoreductase [Planctomyces sp.]